MPQIRRALWLPAVLAAVVAMAGAGSGATAGGVTTKTVVVEVTDVAFDANPNASQWGHVTSYPPGIDCPDDCSGDFAVGDTVTLTVTHPGGYAFRSWGVFSDEGPGCSTADTCTLRLADDGQPSTTVTAALEPEAQLVAVPDGAGTLRFDPVEAGRPSDAPCTTEHPVFDPLPVVCTPRYADGTTVTVTAVPDPGVDASRVRWSNYRCGRALTCTVTVRDHTYLTARFPRAYLAIDPGSFGPVTVTPPGTTCTFDDACQFTFDVGQEVTLRRDPAQAQNPADQWFGSCTGAEETCTVRMRADEYVRAGDDPSNDIPTRVPESLTLRYQGRKGGRIVVTALRSGRSTKCLRTCTLTDYRLRDYVRVSARRGGRARFVRWADAPASGPIRRVRIGLQNPVVAIFRRR